MTAPWVRRKAAGGDAGVNTCTFYEEYQERLRTYVAVAEIQGLELDKEMLVYTATRAALIDDIYWQTDAGQAQELDVLKSYLEQETANEPVIGSAE